MVAAAHPMHGAVLRAAGSAKKVLGWEHGERFARGREQVRAVTTRMRSGGEMGITRRTVAATKGSLLPSPASGRSCFGRWERDAGQNRVPPPPP